LVNDELSLTVNKNIWPAFIFNCEKSLSPSGVMVYVLPFELLQVKFAETVQEFLLSKFERVEIYTFDHLVFDAAGQDTVVLMAFKKHESKGLFFFNIKENEKQDLIVCSLSGDSGCRKKIHVNSKLKWSSHLINDNDLDFLSDISSTTSKMGECLTSRPGLVTAATNFFIATKETIEQYGLDKYAKPVIQKGIFVNGSAEFTQKDYRKLVADGKPSYFIDLNSYNKGEDYLIDSYIEYGESLNLNERFKCKQREFWFRVPIVKPGKGMFFKRCHHYPKLLLNKHEMYTTDSAYNLSPNDEYDIESIIYSFYNPLTLCFSELLGRHYCGGVLELTPNEFRSLPIAYKKASKSEFSSFKKAFSKKNNIKDILVEFGAPNLSQQINLSKSETDRVLSIYDTLIQRRFGKSNKKF